MSKLYQITEDDMRELESLKDVEVLFASDIERIYKIAAGVRENERRAKASRDMIMDAIAKFGPLPCDFM